MNDLGVVVPPLISSDDSVRRDLFIFVSAAFKRLGLAVL